MYRQTFPQNYDTPFPFRRTCNAVWSSRVTRVQDSESYNWPWHCYTSHRIFLNGHYLFTNLGIQWAPYVSLVTLFSLHSCQLDAVLQYKFPSNYSAVYNWQRVKQDDKKKITSSAAEHVSSTSIGEINIHFFILITESAVWKKEQTFIYNKFQHNH